METNHTAKLWSALMFIILGVIFLLENLFPSLEFEDFWPVLLIITGLILIFDSLQKKDTPQETIDTNQTL